MIMMVRCNGVSHIAAPELVDEPVKFEIEEDEYEEKLEKTEQKMRGKL